ncbi:MAG TPA: phytanoyl-CoA dioxygenase family protein [Acidimicrobiales bacterium]|nr:phytanoyl-CoA dioxygenase family protein [Acidimicrobiales bacterium]
MFDPASWPDGDLTAAAREVARLGLERAVYELEVFGLTVVTADRTGMADVCARAFGRACDLIEQRTGTRPDVVGGATHVGVVTPSLHHFLHEDESFQDLVSHDMALALATMLVGARSVIAGTELFMKGPANGEAGLLVTKNGSGLQLGLHSDNVTIPEPFPMLAHACNVTWLLSDYTKDAGALAFVPGSHRLCRQPQGREGVERAVAIEAPAGSLVVWHGNTWHGSYPRTTPGLRTGMATAFHREYMHPHEPVGRDMPADVVRRRGARFATLMGHDVLDWETEGPDYAKLLARPFRFTPYT